MVNEVLEAAKALERSVSPVVKHQKAMVMNGPAMDRLRAAIDRAEGK